MKHPLLAVTLLLVILVTTALVTLSGTILLVGTPLLLVLLGSWLLAPEHVELAVTRRLARERANPDEPVAVRVTVENRGDDLAEILVADRPPDGVRVIEGSPTAIGALASGERLELTYTVAGTRGSYEFESVLLESGGDLMLRPRRELARVEHELVILPDNRALSRIPIAPRRTLVYAGTNPAHQGGEGTEFFDIREHSGAESLRHVNWRASARHPETLFVNEFQQERVADVAILLDCRLPAYPGGATDPLFEASTSAAASLADVTLDAGNRVGYLGYGVSLDWLSPGFGRVQKHRLLNRLARAYPGESHVFSRLEAIPERLFPAGSQIIIVSPLAQDDPRDLERLVAYGYAVMVVTPDPTPRLPDDLEPEIREAARIVRLQRAVLLRRLRHVGIAVVDWDTRGSFEEAVARSMGGILAAWRRRRR